MRFSRYFEPFQEENGEEHDEEGRRRESFFLGKKICLLYIHYYHIY